jgi:glycosyltransferase involved in cell wall biosynthesis
MRSGVQAGSPPIKSTEKDSAEAENRAAKTGAVTEPRRLRMLYIYPDTVGFHADPAKNPLHYLSLYFEGDFLAVWIIRDAERARQLAPRMQQASGRFRFHWKVRNRLPGIVQRLGQLWFQVTTALRMARKHGRYDVVVAHGPFTMALSGLILRRLTGAALIVEFPGHPFRGYDTTPGWLNRMKRRVAPIWTRHVAKSADHVRLLYPSQLDDLGVDISGRSSVFHEFTTVSSARGAADGMDTSDRRYLFFLGFPYYLKGVDVLIKAFHRIAEDFPDHRLVIAGHCPDRTEWDALVGGNRRVDMYDALPHDRAMALMAGCSAFVLPSRTEAMGRVLLEAMAFGKPVVASAVDGIPHYVQDGETGLLFRSGDDRDLAEKLTAVLGDPRLAEQLGHQGRERARIAYCEEKYAEHFHRMALQAIGASRS